MFLFLQHLPCNSPTLDLFSYSNSHPNSSPLQDENHKVMHTDTATNSLFLLYAWPSALPQTLTFPKSKPLHFLTTAMSNLQLLLKSLFHHFAPHFQAEGFNLLFHRETTVHFINEQMNEEMNLSILPTHTANPVLQNYLLLPSLSPLQFWNKLSKVSTSLFCSSHSSQHSPIIPFLILLISALLQAASLQYVFRSLLLSLLPHIHLPFLLKLLK